MARSPATSKKGVGVTTPLIVVFSWRASFAAALINPSRVAVGATGSLAFHCAWASFHDGLGFSRHIVCRWNTGCGGPSSPVGGSTWHTVGVDVAGLQLGFVGAGPLGGVPPTGLNCAKPSNCWSGYPFCAQYCRMAPK